MSRMNWDRVRRENQMTASRPVGRAKTVKITARYDGVCVGCGRRYSRGSTIKPAGLGVKGWRHVRC